MATASQVHILATKEAQSLFRLVGKNGDTVEKIRELIAVPPEIETFLKDNVDAQSLERVLQFRRRVGEEFERLIQNPPERPSHHANPF